MRKKSKPNDRAHMEVIGALRALIDAEYDAGGWLPSSRAMAEKLGVSQPTYCKALLFLEREGLVQSFPRKGHSVRPAYLRIHKIGFILNCGKESPFVHYNSGISPAMDYVAANGYDIHIIQAATPAKLYNNARILGVEGLLWFAPPAMVNTEIQSIYSAGEIPLVVVQSLHSGMAFEDGCVTYNSSLNAQMRVRKLMERGHRKIAFVGGYGHACESGMLDAIQKAGGQLKPEHCIHPIEKMPGAITALIRNEGITGVLSEGGILAVNALFEELSELPASLQPEVLVDHFALLAKLVERFPNVRLVPDNLRFSDNLGLEAAKMLINHLATGERLELVRIAYAGAM